MKIDRVSLDSLHQMLSLCQGMKMLCETKAFPTLQKNYILNLETSRIWKYSVGTADKNIPNFEQ